MSDSRPKASSIRVLLVDDNAMLRQALRNALEAYANIEVVGEASDGEQALVCVAKLQPAAVVMDINLPKMDGITATRLIKAEYPQIAVVGLSVETQDYLVYSMQRVGAAEVVQKENAAGTLYGAIQKAVAAIQPILVLQESLALDSAPVVRKVREQLTKPQADIAIDESQRVHQSTDVENKQRPSG